MYKRQIQEYLECAREIRATNQVPAFLGRVEERVDAFEHAKIRAELTAGVSASSAQALLRLGIGTTVLAGALLIADGQVDFMVFFCFLLAVTRVYDPVNVILQTIIELLDLRLNIARLQAIEDEPVQMCIRDSGKTTLMRLVNGLVPQAYDGELSGTVCVLCLLYTSRCV